MFTKSDRQRLGEIERKVDLLLTKLQALASQEIEMSKAVDNLQASVTKIEGAEDSAIALIQGLAEQLKNISDDPKVQALADELSAKADTLAAAVAANTSPAPPA